MKITPLSILSMIALAGCATHDNGGNAPRPRNGIAEYRQVAVDALKTMDRALHSLDKLAAQPDRCSPKVLAAFSGEAERLEADSVMLRARSRAMQSRGDAYFENWHTNLSRMEDVRVRELAERHHTDLSEGFGRIKTTSAEVGESFRPFLAGLRQLQTMLEKDPAAIGAAPAKDLIRATREHGQQAEQKLTAIKDELDAAARMLTPGN